MYATYSVEDDKIRIYSGRVEPELWERLKAARYQRAYKQECFYAKWSPATHDLAVELCGDIGDEDSTLEDRADKRAKRYGAYSENAQVRSDDAYARVKGITDNIPFGQPILVGHHSERGARADQKRIERGMRKTIDERDKAAYWKRRAETAAKHAAVKQHPVKIRRRIKRLEADLRKYKKERTPSLSIVDWWVNDYRRDVLGHTYPHPDLTDKQTTELVAHVNVKKQKLAAYQDRWIEHVEMHLEFERALYEASGGIAADSLTFQKGDLVKFRGRWEGPVVRVNKSRGDVVSVSVPTAYSWTDKLPVDGITEVKTPEKEESE
jgi:hypothetical protein